MRKSDDTEIPGEFVTSSGRAESPAPTKLSGTPGTVVGVDAYIDPAGCTGFTEIFGESEPSHWADRVVGPYGEISIHSYPVGADDSVRPQNAVFLRKSTANSQHFQGRQESSTPTTK